MGKAAKKIWMPLDDKTNYNDDSDLMSINPIPYSDKPRVIIVPRTIPMEFLPPKDPTPKPEPAPKDKLPDNQLGDEDPIPIFPMDDNPGDITPGDMEKIRIIYKNATILNDNDPIKCIKEAEKKKKEAEKKKKDDDKKKKDDDKKKKDDDKKKKMITQEI